MVSVLPVAGVATPAFAGTIKVHVLHCGQVQVPQLIPYGFTGSYLLKVKLPVAAYLIEPPKGRVLVDTGWNTTVRTNPVGEVGASYLISKPFLPEGQAVNEQLAAMGLSAANLDYVVLTHMDTDHASGLKLVAGAKKILATAEEWAEANSNCIRYVDNMWDGVNVSTFAMQPSAYGPQNSSYDVFGDGSVILVSTPGHAKGHFSVLARNNGKYVLITGDVAYGKKNWEQMVLPGILDDKTKETQALQWVKTLAADCNCLAILPTHDATVVPHTIEF